MRASVELCHSPPRRFSQPVVHNQESPLVSYASYVCESDRPLLNSRHTQTRLTFPREEEEDRGEGPLPPESHILLNQAMVIIYTESRRLPWVDVGIFSRFRLFSRQSEKCCSQPLLNNSFEKGCDTPGVSQPDGVGAPTS